MTTIRKTKTYIALSSIHITLFMGCSTTGFNDANISQCKDANSVIKTMNACVAFHRYEASKDKEIQNLAIKYNSVINSKDPSIKLLIAAKKSDATAAKEAISNGANVNLIDGDETPLRFAIYNNDLEITRLLLKNGANPNLKPNVSDKGLIDIAWYLPFYSWVGGVNAWPNDNTIPSAVELTTLLVDANIAIDSNSLKKIHDIAVSPKYSSNIGMQALYNKMVDHADKEIAAPYIEERNAKRRAIKEREARLTQLLLLKEQQQSAVKYIGNTICRTSDGYTEIYGKKLDAKFRITAFTEATVNNKIKIRIASIQNMSMKMAPIQRLDGDVVMQVGGIIWDEVSSWSTCEWLDEYLAFQSENSRRIKK